MINVYHITIDEIEVTSPYQQSIIILNTSKNNLNFLMAINTMRMNQSKYVIRVERKLITEFTVSFLDVAFHCENEQSVL